MPFEPSARTLAPLRCGFDRVLRTKILFTDHALQIRLFAFRGFG
jgi:hypothetical protein